MTFNKCRLSRQFTTGLRRQIALGVLVSGVSAALAFGQSESPARIPDDEYVVLSAVLDHFAGEGNDLEPNQKFVVWGRTSRGGLSPDSLKRSVESKPKPSPNSGTSDDQYHRRNSLDPVHRERLEQALEMKRKEQVDGAAFKEEVSAEAVSDWTERNADSYQLDHKLDVKKGEVVLFSDDDWRQLESSDASLASQWQAFDEKYPLTGITELSRVGFDHTRTQAIVLVGFRSGPIGGDGYYALLTKESGIWKLRHLLHAWLS